MGRWRDVTVGDLIDGLKRYQPFLLAVLAIVLVAVVLPGRSERGTERAAASGPVEFGGAAGGETSGGVDGGTVTSPGGEVSSGGRRSATTGPNADRSQTGQGAFGGTGGSGGGGGDSFVPGANCDTNTGRIAVPSLYAPPCAPKFDGDNGGATGPGVSGDTIKIAAYIGALDPQTGAILRAAGAEDDAADVWQTYLDYADYFNAHYETYGRKIEMVRIDGGQPADETAAKANAEEVKDAGAFLSLDGPTDTNVYMRELASAGIICICTQSQPIQTYLDNAPYVWSNLMSSTQLYVHRAEYVGKRLWGKAAKWAGQADFKVQPRTFALVYFDTPEGSYKAGADFFVEELQRYGASLKIPPYAVTGAHVDTAGAQKEAQTVSQKLKDEGISTVLFSGDPLYPIFLTQEATQDLYFPEWIVTGSVLTDTTLFGSLYDQNQWEHAFGLSALAARTSEELSESYRVNVWHHGEPPVANTHAIRYAPFWIAATGIHMAGERLTVESFRDGLFAYPRTGDGPVHPSTSFGKGLWRWDDYLRLDDTAELWWDRTAPGQSEVGSPVAGQYRYVEGGKRYRAGQWPSTEPNVFNEAGTVTVYESRETVPDPWPEYEHQAH